MHARLLGPLFSLILDLGEGEIWTGRLENPLSVYHLLTALTSPPVLFGMKLLGELSPPPPPPLPPSDGMLVHHRVTPQQ